jgi:hypothetical protein
MGYDSDSEPKIPAEYVDMYWEQHEAAIHAQQLQEASHPWRDALALFFLALVFLGSVPGIIVAVRMQSSGFDSAWESVEESIIGAIVLASLIGLGSLLRNLHRYRKLHG